MMKILLVDDNDVSNFIMRKFLEKEGLGKTIVEYTDPKQALESIPRVQPELLFLDLQMPHLNGWQFLDAMNNKGYNLRTVILTSSTNEKDRERIRNFPEVIFYAVKPMEELQLKEVLTLIN